MASDDDFVKIGIRDDDGDVETPWAVRLGDNLYRLDNIPFFAYRISTDDIVEAVRDGDGMLMFQRVVQKSGNRTLRVALTESCRAEPGPTLIATIRRLGCSFEGAYETLVCINVPPEVSLEVVAEALTELGVRWEYADPAYVDLFPRDGEASAT
jgi:hypothetical protein